MHPQHPVAPLHNEISVVWARFSSLTSQLERLSSYLSVDEVARAARYHFDSDRHKFIISHGSTRSILAFCLSVLPTGIQLKLGEFGKPELSTPLGTRQLGFNISHSGDLFLMAMAWDRNVGIDVEYDGAPFDHETMHHFFTQNEQRALAEVVPGSRSSAFYQYWTCKEAYLKACGQGLSAPLDSFEVAFASDAPPAFVRGVDPAWRLTTFKPVANYWAALVHDGAPARLRMIDVSRLLCEQTMARLQETGAIAAGWAMAHFQHHSRLTNS